MELPAWTDPALRGRAAHCWDRRRFYHLGPMDRPTAIITGAGSGIGRAVAIALAREGYALVLAGRRADALAQSVTLCAPAACLPVPTDVGSTVQVRSLVAAAMTRFGRLDALVNAAGWAEIHAIEASGPEVFERAFAINTFGPAAAISAAWPIFTRQHRGCVVNVSSMATADPMPGFFAYAASKAAVDLMARCAALEGAAVGVRAFSVAPGAVETPLLRSLISEQALPTAKCLEPEFVARVIVDCIQGERDEDNGQVIYLPSPA